MTVRRVMLIALLTAACCGSLAGGSPSARAATNTTAGTSIAAREAPRPESAQVPTDSDGANRRGQEYVEAGKESLGGGFVNSSHPWYDEQADQATLIPLPKPKVQSTGPPWYQFLIDFFDWMNEPLFTFTVNGRQYSVSKLMALLTLIILAPIIYLIWRLYKHRSNAAKRTAAAGMADDERTHAQRLEALPFQIKAADNLLEVARRLAAKEQYKDALIYLFSYQLVELDRKHFIRLTKGKTNRQYLRELEQAKLRSLMEHATVAFEDAFFGHYEISQARFQESWSRVEEFHRLIGVWGRLT